MLQSKPSIIALYRYDKIKLLLANKSLVDSVSPSGFRACKHVPASPDFSNILLNERYFTCQRQGSGMKSIFWDTGERSLQSKHYYIMSCMSLVTDTILAY